jgi:hypothetical protein
MINGEEILSFDRHFMRWTAGTCFSRTQCYIRGWNDTVRMNTNLNTKLKKDRLREISKMI